MKDLLLNPLTKSQIDAFLAAPSHALMLTGPSGSGKRTLAVAVAETVLQLPASSFAGHPYALLIAPEDGKAIGIEAVRSLEQFLALKVPGKTAHDRAIIIEDAHLLTIEAQNALLKMLEEPPHGTVLILTVSFQQSVLPTIRSRTQLIPIGRLERQRLEAHFGQQDFDEATVKKAYAISGGLPGRMHALLHEEDHPLMEATEIARKLLSQTAYERLITVDGLAKQRALAIDVAAILQQMAHVSLQTATGAAAQKWHGVLSASYEASEALSASAQPKLALTKLMLSL
jgi:replication-associated recombination protein RarA